MKELYPFFNFINKEYSDKGHPRSMNILRKVINTPYFFHCEDDWCFIEKRNYLTECLDIINDNENIGQCLINKNYAETLDDVNILGGIYNITKFGNVYYTHEP